MLPCGHWCLLWTPPQQCEPQSRAVGACQGLFTDEIWEMCFVSLSISTPMYTIDAFRRRLLCPQVSSHLLAQLTICTLLCGCSWLIMLSAMGQVQLLICIGTVFAAKDTDLYHTESLNLTRFSRGHLSQSFVLIWGEIQMWVVGFLFG